MTQAQIEVLALGLGFCPDQDHNLFTTIKDVNLFVRKLTLKTLHHKNTPTTDGTAALMRLSLSECRQLREFFLLDSQEAPSTPTPLLEAMENISDASPNEEDTSPALDENTSSNQIDLPKLSDLKPKSKTYPPPHH